MRITSAQFTDSGRIIVNGNMHVPDTEHDRDRWGITAWVDEGNVIADYTPPPPLTPNERVDRAFPLSDREQVLFKILFKITNRVIALEGGTALTPTKFKNLLKAELP